MLTLSSPPPRRIGINVAWEASSAALHAATPQVAVALRYPGLCIDVRESRPSLLHQLVVVGDHVL